MELETRAETVPRFRSRGAGGFCGFAEACGCVPFRDTPGVDFWGVEGVSTLLTVTLEEAETEGEQGLDGEERLDTSVSADVDAPGWTGGRGARYLTLVGCDGGESGCDAGEDDVFAGVAVGTGGAGDFVDLRLEDTGVGLDGSLEVCGFKGSGGVCCWPGGSADSLLGDERFSGLSFWSTEVLLSSRMVNS